MELTMKKSEIIYINNFPFIKFNNEIIPYLAFRSFRPDKNNIGDFYNAGIRLFQMLVSGVDSTLSVPYSLFGPVWVDKDEYDFTAFDNQMSLFLSNTKNSYINVMVSIDTPKKYKGIPDSFNDLGNAIFSEEYKDQSIKFLKAFIEYAERKYGDAIYQYSIACGNSTEWFVMPNENSIKEKADAFKLFTNDNKAIIPNIKKERENTNNFRESNSIEYKYLDFMNENCSNFILDVLREIQNILNHNKLVGLFYGYINCHPVWWQTLTCTSYYERIWNSNDVDMIYSPTGYGFTNYGKPRKLPYTTSFQLAVDSLPLSNKVYLHELDLRTHLAGKPIQGTDFRMWLDTEDEYETIEVMRRELGICLIKKSAMWWFDFFGGYYDSDILRDELKLEIELYNKVSRIDFVNKCEVAVFVDPVSYLNITEVKETYWDIVDHPKFDLSFTGTPYKLFNLNDIKKINLDEFKCLIFLNAVSPNNQIREFIKNINNKKKIFLWASGLNYNNALCTSNISDFVGINIKENEEKNKQVVTYKNKEFSNSSENTTSYYVDDLNTEPIAYYSNGRVAVAKNDNNYYIGSGNPTKELFRDLLIDSNVFMYTKIDEPIEFTDKLILVHSMNEQVEIKLQNKNKRYLELFENKIYEVENNTLSYISKKGKTKLFLLLE